MGSSYAGTDPKELPEFHVGALVQPKVRWLVGVNVVVCKGVLAIRDPVADQRFMS